MSPTVDRKVPFSIVIIILLIGAILAFSYVVFIGRPSISQPTATVTSVIYSTTTTSTSTIITVTKTTPITTIITISETLTQTTTYTPSEGFYNIIADIIKVKPERVKIVYLRNTGLDDVYAVLAYSTITPPTAIGILYDMETNSIKKLSFRYTPTSEMEAKVFNHFLTKCRCPFCGATVCLPSMIAKLNQTHYKVEYYDGWCVIGKHWSKGLALVNIETWEITYIEHTK